MVRAVRVCFIARKRLFYECVHIFSRVLHYIILYITDYTNIYTYISKEIQKSPRLDTAAFLPI